MMLIRQTLSRTVEFAFCYFSLFVSSLLLQVKKLSLGYVDKDIK